MEIVNINFFGKNKRVLLGAGDSNAPTIIFFHGFPDNKSVWEGFFKKLPKEMNKLAIDLEDLNSGDLIESQMFLLQCLKQNGISVNNGLYFIGHDIGGPVMSFLSSHFKSDLRGMIYLNSMDLTTYRRNMVGAQLLKSWYALAFQVPPYRWLMKRQPRSLELVFRKFAPEHRGEIYFQTIDHYKYFFKKLFKNKISINAEVPKLIILSKDDPFLKIPKKSMLPKNTEICVVRGGHWDILTQSNIALKLIDKKLEEWGSMESEVNYVTV